MYPIIFDLQLKIDYFNYLNKKSIQNTSKFEGPKIELKDDENVLKNSYRLITGGDGSDWHIYESWRKDFTPTILDSDKSWYDVICDRIFTKSDLFKKSPNKRCVMINPNNNKIEMFSFYIM